MGRMLETLKQGDGARMIPARDRLVADSAVQDCVVDWEIGEEVPFVEVGGPNKKVELSPGLMAHPAQAAPQPPHHAIEAAPIAKAKAVAFTPTQPMSVAYEACTLSPAVSASLSPEVIAYHQPNHPVSKEYASLLDAMLNGLNETASKILLLIGSKPTVGVNTVLANLAAIAAQQKKMRVVLVEATGCDSGLARLLGHTAHAGLADVLAGALALEQAILKTPIGTLQWLPAGEKKLPLTPEASAWLCAWLRERYDLILIDGPDLQHSAELGVVVPQAHGIYLVLPQGETPGKAMAQTIGRLGGRLCGLIHTQFEA